MCTRLSIRGSQMKIWPHILALKMGYVLMPFRKAGIHLFFPSYGQTVFFWFDTSTKLEEGKLWIWTNFAPIRNWPSSTTYKWRKGWINWSLRSVASVMVIVIRNKISDLSSNLEQGVSLHEWPWKRHESIRYSPSYG